MSGVISREKLQVSQMLPLGIPASRIGGLTWALGKQLVYHAKQDPNDFMSPEELTAMDQEIESVRSDIVARKAEQKVLQATCNVLKSTPTTDALRDSVSALEAEKDSLEARLRVFRSGDVAPVNVEGKEKAERALRTMQRQAGNRKKIFWELWAMVTENQPEGITKEDLWVR